MANLAVALLKLHEGFRADVYRCTAGKRTIGYGYNLDANPLGLRPDEMANLCKSGISEPEALELLTDMISDIEQSIIKHLKWFDKLCPERQAALVDMTYNLGINGVLKFQQTLMFLERRDYGRAADNMLKSLWAKQVGQRAVTLSEIIRTGKLAQTSAKQVIGVTVSH